MTTPREAFKLGFARRCAEEGLTPEQADARAVKAAALLEKRGGVWDTLVKAHPLEMTVGAPLAAGAALGYGAHKLTEPAVDEEDVRRQELIDELRHWTRRAREQQKSKTVRLAPV